jgi:[ribosomal protein S18]-alanine N-acetyltransferase
VSSSLTLHRLEPGGDAEWCARLMASSEPWITLGRSYEESLRIILDPSRESYLAVEGDARAGFVILCTVGPFTGYIQTLCVSPDRRGNGLGTRLLAMAEERLFALSPNVFLCVSSFNAAARRLYEREGYQLVGELPDYLVRGHSELLFRKSRGPWSEFA